MNLLATQSGTVKKIATNTETIDAPCFQTIDVVSGVTSYKLTHAPKTGTTPKFYVLKGDGTLGDKITVDDTASGKTIANSGRTVTIVVGDSGYAVGDQIFAMFEYVADGSAAVTTSGSEEGAKGAVEVVNSATNFPVGCKFIMEILGADVCNQTELIYAYLIFNNAKLSPDFDWSIATDSTHPFSMKAMQDYCSKTKELFKIVIPEE